MTGAELSEVISHDGTRLPVRVVGRGDPVVLVHGSAGGLDSWTGVADLLADEFELWTYARRGYGTGDVLAGPKTFADDVADLAVVLEAAGHGRPVHLVGKSYGASVALHGALAHPAALRSLTVFEPPLYAAGPAPAVLGQHRALVGQGAFARAARLFAEQVAQAPAELVAAMPATDPEPPDADDAREAVGCLHDLEALVADEPGTERWREIAVPSTVVQGELTWSPMPETMAALVDVLPAGTERIVLAGQSHFATHTAPELFAETLRTVLGRPAR